MSELGENLSLDLLSEDDDNILNLDDIMMNPPSKEVSKEQINNSSDPPKGEESVAGEEAGQQKAPEKKPAPAGNSSPDDQMSQIYSSLATQLQTSGVLSNFDKDTEIKDYNGIKAAIEKEILSGISESEKAYQEALKKGVSEDKFIGYERTMSSLNSITPEAIAAEEGADLRKNIIAQDFINRSFSKEDALRYAQRSIDLGEDVEDATKALETIKEYTKTSYQQEVKKTELEEQEINNNIKSFIDKKDEVIEGIKLDDNLKEKLFKQITTPLHRDKDGTLLSKYGKSLKDNPVEMKVVTEYLFMITDGFKDFSKLNNTIETNKTRELDSILKTNASVLAQGVASQSDNQSNFLLDDLTIDD